MDRKEPGESDRPTITTPGRSGSDGPNENLLEGERVGEYLVKSAIASGGCGVVYAAEHRLLRRPVAIKVLRSSMASEPTSVQRFVLEAKAVNRIRHANIVDVHDFGFLADGRPYHVMELIDAPSLSDVLKHRGPFSAEETLALLEPVCSALSAAHREGIIHRDLKANNILFGGEPGKRIIKLLDFGIAKLLEPQPGEAGLTAAGSLIGSPHSMAPEQVTCGAIDERTDIYALGALTFRILTGTHPFEGADSTEIHRMHLFVPPPRLRDVLPISAEIDAVVLRCLQKRPADRFPNVNAFLDAFREAVGGRSSQEAADAPCSVPALGLYIKANVPEEALEDPDDMLLSDLANAIEIAQAGLARGRFILHLEAGNAVLGVLLLPESPTESLAERRRGLEIARAVAGDLAERDTRDERVRVQVCLHASRVLVRVGSGGTSTIVGGPLVALENWVAQEDLDGACVTPTVLEDLAELAGEPTASGKFLTITEADRALKS